MRNRNSSIRGCEGVQLAYGDFPSIALGLDASKDASACITASIVRELSGPIKSLIEINWIRSSAFLVALTANTPCASPRFEQQSNASTGMKESKSFMTFGGISVHPITYGQ